MAKKWVPLHVHSQYSILDASASVQEIAARAAAFGMPAVALTDHGNLYGAVDFYKACKAEKVKPILGCEVYVAPYSRKEKTKGLHGKTAYHLVLLAKNRVGYRNLCKLVSIGFLEGFYYHPRIDKECLTTYKEGLICLSGCLSSSVASVALHGSDAELHAEIGWFHECFGEDYYLELQRHGMSQEDLLTDEMNKEAWVYQNYEGFLEKQTRVNERLVAASRLLGIPLVATNDSHYIQRQDWRAHEILLNIQSGEPCEIWERDSLGNPKVCVPNPKRRVYASHELYFKAPEQIASCFADLPEAIENTQRVADKCELELDFKTKHYPLYLPPSLEGKTFNKKDQIRETEAHLRALCEEGVGRRYTQERLHKVQTLYPNRPPLDVVRERLEMEMSVITSKGMCDYLLIVHDFIHWAKQHGVPMGPGRGSGAGSIVLYLIGVTDIEPLRFHLFFERFINLERFSYPDIDVDICMERRGEVIEYTLKKYGQDNVAQIITFGTMKAKMAIKDVGRVLSIPLAKVNAIAKLVPEDPNMTLDKALDTDPELCALYQRDGEARRIIDIGKRLEGSIRNTGIHAAGIVISAQPLVEVIPLCNAKDSSMAVTQYSMKPVEQVGMLKIDFLGLKTLTCIQKTVDAVSLTHGIEIDWTDLSLEDEKTFALLNQGKTLGIFQLESTGMRELCRQLHIDRFEEIIAVGSLYRPGPMEMIPSFIQRKHGKEPIEYDHPWMADILAETYGIMVYQEQVMQIASKLANYSLGEGDVLRYAMGKKNMAEMARQRDKFRQGAKQNGIEEEISTRIFDKMEKFASYGFNKSHAAAYAYLSYVTAYLKAHYPKEWMAALMTCDLDDLTKVAKFIRECQSLSIPILPPDINAPSKEFLAFSEGIRFAMTGIRGIGEGVVEAIIEERRAKGPFTDLFDFICRIDTKRVGKKTIEVLVEAGCFDFTSWPREALRASVDSMYEVAAREQKERAFGIMSLFDLMEEEREVRFSTPPAVPPLSKMALLNREKELLGFFLTGHPLDSYRPLLQRLSCIPLHHLETMEHDVLFRAGIVVESVEVRTAVRTGKKFAITLISDGIDRYELPIWSELYEEKGHLLRENQLLYLLLQLDKREEVPKLSCRWLEDLTQVTEEAVQACERAYERAKLMMSRPMRKGEPTSFKKKEMTKAQKRLHILVDADQARLSQMMKLKKLFQAHRGSTPLELEFRAKGKPLGSVFVEASWGIEPSSSLCEEICDLPMILSCRISS